MKALITSGCSLSIVDEVVDMIKPGVQYPRIETWPIWLEKEFEPEYHSASGQQSVGTDLISRRAIYHCTQALKQYKGEDILCVCTFSTLYRTAGIFHNTDMLPKQLLKNLTNEELEDRTFIEQGTDFDVNKKEDDWSWYYWNLWRDKPGLEYFYTYYNSEMNLIEQYLWNVLAVKNFCAANNIHFYYSFIENLESFGVDIDHWSIKHLYDSVTNTSQFIPYGISQWVNQHYPKLIRDDIHPTSEGHELYAKKILIPHIRKYVNI